MIRLGSLSLTLLIIFMAEAAGQELWDIGSPQDWLSVGPIYARSPYYWPYYSYDRVPYYEDVSSGFTDPFFYPRVRRDLNGYIPLYYPYFGDDFFRNYGILFSYGPYNLSGPYYSEMRIKAVARQQWPEFRKDWISTMEYARTKSSMRTYRDGMWLPP